MNSFDPWHVMQSSPPGALMVVPPPYYSSPLFDEFCEEGRSIFLGAEPPASPRFSAHVELGPDQVLHAKINVDGYVYEGSLDLAAAIQAVLQQLVQFHSDLHAAMPAHGAPTVSGDFVVGAIDRAVAVAADELVGALVDRHMRVGGFLSDIGNAIKGVGSDVLGAVQSTVKTLKGPIEVAATAAATAIPGVGPVVAPMAAKLVGPLIDTAANLGKPHPAVVAAQQQAQTDPQAAQALAAAQTATAHTITAFHVAETAKQAADGHPVAQQQIAQIAQAVEQGDPVAHAVAPVVAHVLSHHHAHRHGHNPRQAAVRAITQVLQRFQQTGGVPAAIGYVRLGHQQQTRPFGSSAEAARWIQSLAPTAFSYAAAFDVHNLATPVAERSSRVV